MLCRATIRATALLAALSTAALAQNALQPRTLATPADDRAAPQSTGPSVVTYTGGELTITANNTSLNQILREISSQLHMKITGGVTDQPVFGDYGPAAPAAVLNQLLDGTGINVLLVQSPAHLPVELVLTPRNGAPTPPNPNAEAERNTQGSYNSANRPYNNQRFGNNNPAFMQNRSMPPEANNPNGSSTVQPAQTMPQSPNGVLTPQEIYEQRRQLLLQRQQQNSQ